MDILEVAVSLVSSLLHNYLHRYKLYTSKPSEFFNIFSLHIPVSFLIVLDHMLANSDVCFHCSVILLYVTINVTNEIKLHSLTAKTCSNYYPHRKNYNVNYGHDWSCSIMFKASLPIFILLYESSLPQTLLLIIQCKVNIFQINYKRIFFNLNNLIFFI